jgi:hypothetical protein
LQECYFF